MLSFCGYGLTGGDFQEAVYYSGFPRPRSQSAFLLAIASDGGEADGALLRERFSVPSYIRECKTEEIA